MSAPILWRYTAGEMRRRPGRTLLTLLGIVIGVTAAVATSVTVKATQQAHGQMFEAAAGRAALEVVAEGFAGFDPALTTTLVSVPGVKEAVPVIQTPAALIGPGGAVPVLAFGIDPIRDGATRDYILQQGRLPSEENEVILVAPFAAAQRLELGRMAKFVTPTGFAELRIVGLLEPRGAAAFNGGAAAFLPLPTAQRLFKLSGQVNSVQLVLAAGADAATVEAAVRERLPAGLVVQTPAARGALGREGMAAIQQGLATLSGSSLVAGAFVILNAFLMNLGERRRQLAILRALGASRRQVIRLLLREAMLLGTAGTVLGIIGGLALAGLLRQTMSSLMAVNVPDPGWPVESILVAVVLGPGMALAATLFPARRAGRREPLPDLLQKQTAISEPVRYWPGYIGLALLAIVGAGLIGLLNDWWNHGMVVMLVPLLAAMYLSGCVLIVPLVQGPLLRLAGALLRPLLGPESALAVKQLARRRSRTALTAGVLVAAVVLAVGFGQSFRNNLRDIRQWCDHLAQTDYYVRAAWADVSTAITTAALPESLAKEIGAWPEVDHVNKFNFVMAHAEGQPVVVMACGHAPDRQPVYFVAEGDPSVVRDALLHGEAAPGTALVRRLGLKVGDSITLETSHGSRSFRIAGTVVEYTGGGLAVYLDWEVARDLFDLQGAHCLLVTARPGATAALGERLSALSRERGLLLQSGADFRTTFDAQIAGFEALVWMLVALVFVVASLGMVNTLTMNVLEQTRDFGVLRAIGLKRRQASRIMVAQALSLCVISLVPGVVAGVGLAYTINLATYPILGQRVPFQLSPLYVGGCLGGAVAIVLLAALLPARRAARLSVVQALQYE